MEYRKNDMVTLEITDCGVDGEGIGKVDGFTVFVKDAVIGDTVEAKILEGKKELWLRTADESAGGFPAPRGTGMRICGALRWLSAAGIVL